MQYGQYKNQEIISSSVDNTSNDLKHEQFLVMKLLLRNIWTFKISNFDQNWTKKTRDTLFNQSFKVAYLKPIDGLSWTIPANWLTSAERGPFSGVFGPRDWGTVGCTLEERRGRRVQQHITGLSTNTQHSPSFPEKEFLPLCEWMTERMN